MEKVTVSIIVPTFNRPDLIRRAILSVLNQTYTKFEIIVVIDGADDDTLAVLKDFKEERVRHVIHEKNRGVSAARNTGILAARGKYIALLDDDDEWMPSKLEKQVAAADNTVPEIGVIYTDYLEYDDESHTVNYKEPLDGRRDAHEQICQGGCITPSVSLIKKECLMRVGLFDEGLKRCEDWELWLRISEYYKFMKISEPLVVYHIVQGRLSDDVSLHLKFKEAVSLKYLINNRKSLAHNVFYLGIKWYDLGEHRLGQKYIYESIRLDPINLMYAGAAVATLGGSKIYMFTNNVYKKLRMVINRRSRLPH